MFLHSEPMSDSSPRENIIDVEEDALGQSASDILILPVMGSAAKSHLHM